MPNAERVLFVHAHPDDEAISTGGTLATLVDAGAVVSVLTCTRGERGEVIPPDLQYLLSFPQSLGERRTIELRSALTALGVEQHSFLGEADARWAGLSPRRYTDSGMQWGPRGAMPIETFDTGSLTSAEFGEVAADVAAVILRFQPTAVVSYDENGGYGHPDHVRAHEAARRAADVYGVPFFAIEPAVSAGEPTLSVDVSPVFERKTDALRAHLTQVVVEGDRFALSNGEWQPITRLENFRRIGGTGGFVPFGRRSLVVKALGAVLGTAAGLAIGAMLTIVHQSTASLGGTRVPLALAASVVVLAALLVGLRVVFASRIVVGFTAFGVMAAVAILSLPNGGGTVLVPGNAVGIAWAVAPTLIAVVVLAWPHLPSRPTGKIGTSE